MLINLIDKNCAKILLFLAISPGSRYNRKELKKETEMYNWPLDISLSKLVNLKLLIREKKLYSLNLENTSVKVILSEIKKMANLPMKIKVILMEFIEQTTKIKLINDIILFGSYSKLIFTDKSDIDLAIITEDNLERKVNSIAGIISRKYKKEIQVHFFNEKDLKHKEDPLIKDILRNGISLI